MFLRLLLNVSLNCISAVVLSGCGRATINTVNGTGRILNFLALTFGVVSDTANVVIDRCLKTNGGRGVGVVCAITLSFGLILDVMVDFIMFVFDQGLLRTVRIPTTVLSRSSVCVQVINNAVFARTLVGTFGSVFTDGNGAIFNVVVNLKVGVVGVYKGTLLLCKPLRILKLNTSNTTISAYKDEIVTMVTSIVCFCAIVGNGFDLGCLHPFPCSILGDLLGLNVPATNRGVSCSYSRLFLRTFVGAVNVITVGTGVCTGVLSVFACVVTLTTTGTARVVINRDMNTRSCSFTCHEILGALHFNVVVSVSITVMG